VFDALGEQKLGSNPTHPSWTTHLQVYVAHGSGQPPTEGFLRMQHNFDISIAAKFGVNVAIFLNNIQFWVHKNMANNKHFYDGKYWTYNSVKAFAVLFPYWTNKQIEKIVKDCFTHGLLEKGNYNHSTYDRTSWYTLTEKSAKLLNFPISSKREMDFTKNENGFTKKGKSTYTDIKPEINTESRTRKKRVSLSDFEPDEEMILLLANTTQRCGTPNLMDKFRTVMKTQGKSTSPDWNAELKLFLMRERPTIVKNVSNYKTEEPQRPRMRDYTEERLEREAREARQQLN
jgi:hypothetical protein